MYDLYVENFHVYLFTSESGWGGLKVRLANYLGFVCETWAFFAAIMIRDTGADYKKAIVAVAIAGGVGATVAGAGLLAYRLWRRRTCRGREKKSDKHSEPVHTVSIRTIFVLTVCNSRRLCLTA